MIIFQKGAIHSGKSNVQYSHSHFEVMTMPAGYAHFRFGNNVLPHLPPDAAKAVQSFRQLYDVGLQGPDLLFYYNPVFRTETGELAYMLHRQSGKEFFGNALRRMKTNSTECAVAYLYGILGHYCLDSLCHPYIHGVSAEGKIGHTEMESEFDRFLMEKDGIAEPHFYRMDRHFRLSRKDCDTAALLLEPATPAALRKSNRNMIWVSRLTTMRNRKLAAILLGFGGKTGLEMLIPERLNEKCVGTDAALMNLYRQAAEKYPVLARQLYHSITTGEPLGDAFVPCFG